MKIAILISGESRFNEVFDQFIKNLEGYTEIDWFFYLWENSTYGTDKGFVAPSWNNLTEEKAYNKIRSNLPGDHNIARIVIDNPTGITFPEITGPKAWIGADGPHRIFTQFLGIYKVDQLRQQYPKDYDIVIRTRPDVGFLNTVNLKDVKRILDEQHKTIVVPCNHPDWGTRQLLNDNIIMALPEVMSVYTNVYNMAKSYDNTGISGGWGCETTILHHLKLNNIGFTHNNFKMTDLSRLDPCVFGKWG
jgi:hypothetical protein